MASGDPLGDEIADDLVWLRRQRDPFDSRLARAKRLVQNVGGGSLRQAKQELERIRRAHAHDPDSDISAYFASAGYRTKGETLDQRLRSYAARRHVVQRTALRRSDRGAVATAQLLRDRLLYARPWAYLIAAQQGDELRVWVNLLVEPGTDMRLPTIYANGGRVDVDPTITTEQPGYRDKYWYHLPDQPLDTSVDAGSALAEITLTWPTEVAPSWELVTRFTDERVYGHFTVEPHQAVHLEVRWWDADAAATPREPLRR